MGIERRVAKARRLAREGHYSDALYIWRDVCVEAAPSPQYRVELASCLVELGAEDEALFELETALALDFTVISTIEADVRFSTLLDRLR